MCKRLRVAFLCAALLAIRAVPAAAAAYDLNPDNPFVGPLPTDVGAGGSPVYITNTTATEARATANVDSLRVGQRGSLNIGFDAGGAASGPVVLGVDRDMTVEGRVRVGTLGAGSGGASSWLPGGRTGYASGLTVGGTLSVRKGGEVLVEGGRDDGAGMVEHSGVAAGRIDVNGGAVRINPDGELIAASAMDIRNGGRVTVASGLPPRDADEMTDGDWVFKGLGLGAGGLDVGRAGLLEAGAGGATVDGMGANAGIRVQRGGFLDASANDMLLRSVGGVSIDGTYRSGVGAQLTSESGRIDFGAESKAVLSTDLYRLINNSGVAAADSIARARGIGLAPGAETIRSGMGFYSLGVVPFEEAAAPVPDPVPPVRSGSGELLRVTGASRTVSGDGSAADRAQFRDNLASVWNSPVESSQAEAMYDLLAGSYPAVEASGEAGQFNRDALEGIMNGPGAGIPARGVADRGVAELYSGGAQWGANAVAFGTAELFMAGLDRRVHRIGAELDRLGHGEAVSSESANASLLSLFSRLFPPGRQGGTGRVWTGMLHARDGADADAGVSGHVYRPRGFMLGYDRTVDRWTLGGALGYARGSYDDKAAEADDSRIDSYSGGLFAAYHGDDGFNASAFATVSGLDNDFSDTRGGMRRSADFTSHAWSAGARLGYDMRIDDRLILQPSVGVTHVRARSGGHDESLDGVEVMRVGDIDRSGTLVPVDLTFGYDLLRNFDSLIRLNAGIGYAYDLGGKAPEGTLSYNGLAGAPEVNIAERSPGRHRLNLGLGLVYTRERFDWNARYDFVRRASQSTHQVNTQLGLKF